MKMLAIHSPLRLSARPLVLLLLLAAGLFLAHASWQRYQATRAEADAAEIEATQIARKAAHHQQAVLDQTYPLLRVLGSISVTDTRDPAACRNFLARQLERFGDYDNLAFLRADGSPYCSARPMPAQAPALRPPEARPGMPVLLTFQPDGVAAVLPHEARGLDGMAIAAYMPLRDFLFGRASRLPANAGFAVLNIAGQVIAAYPARSEWTSKGPGFAQTLLDLESGVATRLPASGGGSGLYVVQPLPAAVQPLWLAIRMPADAADELSHQMLLLWSALILAAFATWLLSRIAIRRAIVAYRRRDWTPLGAMMAPGNLPAPFHRQVQPVRGARPPGETTVLRLAYENLKRAFADKEEHMQQIILLDTLSRNLQNCHTMTELAQSVARCATALFPGSSGSLLRRTSSQQLEAIHSWGDPSPISGKITLPLMANHESLGILNLTGINEFDPWSTTSLAERVTAGMVMLKRQAQLRSRAIRDGLTGLYNRHFLEAAMAIEQRRALRRGTPIGVMMLDIDHFKRFNDTHGHDAGDILLRGMGALLRQAVREGDMPCRYGGEEFVVILPGADLAGTRQRAEALRAAIAQWQPQRDGQSLGQVTVSIGVASLPMHGSSWSRVMKAADEALYASKHNGRNQVTVAPEQ